jgi:hypothetical protein
MEAEAHPDLFGEAARHGLQRVMQIASCAGTAAQVYVAHQRTQARAVAEQDDRARRAIQAEIRAERQAARAAWAPAADGRWLGTASLAEAAAAWAAAVPYADRAVPWYDPSAVSAMRKAEGRLRDLHPYAMARYDRLRESGLSPAEAMAQAAPLFARHPSPRDAPYTPRQELGAGAGITWTAEGPAAGDESGSEEAAAGLERRGAGIVTALQERARAEGREPLGPDELRTVLETVTSLPPDTITRLTSRAGRERPAGAGPVAAGGRRTARPWELDFPIPVHEVVATAAGPAPVSGAAAAGARRVAGRAPQPGGPGHAG